VSDGLAGAFYVCRSFVKRTHFFFDVDGPTVSVFFFIRHKGGGCSSFVGDDAPGTPNHTDIVPKPFDSSLVIILDVISRPRPLDPPAHLLRYFSIISEFLYGLGSVFPDGGFLWMAFFTRVPGIVPPVHATGLFRIVSSHKWKCHAISPWGPPVL